MHRQRPRSQITLKVMLAGPIKAWWDQWNTPEHKAYVAWREYLSEQLVAEGHLVYHPHHAFRGPWDESAQTVNDWAIAWCDVVLNLAPVGVLSHGTDQETAKALVFNKPIVEAAPPLTGDRPLDHFATVHMKMQIAMAPT